jgi:hypothetical protein
MRRKGVWETSNIQVARKAAQDIAGLIITAGCQIPGTQRRRHARPGRRNSHRDTWGATYTAVLARGSNQSGQSSSCRSTS